MWASADGLTGGRQAWLQAAVGPEYARRMVSADRVVHAFRATRTPLETKWFRNLQTWTSQWETEALASAVKPGETTVLALVHGLEDASGRFGLDLAIDHGRFPMIVWFGRSGGMPGLKGFESSVERRVEARSRDPRDFPIEPGDLITLDGGLRFLGLTSDMKRSAYVLRSGETGPPASLRKAWQDTLNVADLFASRLVPGADSLQVWNGLNAELVAHGFEVAGSGTGAPPSIPSRPRVSVYAHSTGNVVHDVG